jgi:hypothetical protein
LIERACFSAILGVEQVTDDARRLVPALDAGGHHLVISRSHIVEQLLQSRGIGVRIVTAGGGGPVPSQDIENGVGRMDAIDDGFGTGRLDSRQAVGQYRRQHPDHLAVAIIRTLQLTAQALQIGRQEPVLEVGPLRYAPGFLASTGT